jgi:hypothetical protein
MPFIEYRPVTPFIRPWTRRRTLRLFGGFGLATAGCDSRQTGPLAQGSDLDGHIPLGPQATIRATLTSNEALTLFSVAGVGARSELLLPSGIPSFRLTEL